MEYSDDGGDAASQPDLDMEDGWPITDIIEELDDEDNVVSYRLISADDSINRVQAALEKAGVTKQAESKPTTTATTTTTTTTTQEQTQDQRPSADPEKAASSDQGKPARDLDGTVSHQPTTQEDEAPTAAVGPSAKKTVSFSEDVATQEAPQPEISFRARRVEQIMNTAKEQEQLSQKAPIIPEDEDEDDAALRQEMLRYGMGEIGAVVAELQLEEGAEEGDEDDSDMDFDEGFDEEEDEDEDDLEDEYGRNGRVVTGKYRQRMLELEKKLGIQSRPPQGQPVDKDKDSSDDEGIGRIVIKRETGDASASKERGSPKPPVHASAHEPAKGENDGKKSVRFASSLDIAPEKASLGASPVPTPRKQETDKEVEREAFVDPLSDIVERSPSSSTTRRQPAKKASRFKTARGDAPGTSAAPRGPMDLPAHFADQERPSAPSGPEGATIADTLVEREPTSAPVPPDEFDGSIAYHEVADEYQKMRRRFIQREGGFLRQDESPVQPVVDEENQEPVSRFKAARLSRQ